MNTNRHAPTLAPIVRPPGEGERFERANRVVTIKADLPEISIHEIEFDSTFEVPPHAHDHSTRCSSSKARSTSSAKRAVAESGPEPSSLSPPGRRTASAIQVRGARGS